MFLTSLLSFVYGIVCFFIILLVLIQRGKGSMGIGNLGGSNQMLFGSSGGQDIFQKITWFCCVILFVGSLLLAIYAGKHSEQTFNYKMPISASQSLPVDDEL